MTTYPAGHASHSDHRWAQPSWRRDRHLAALGSAGWAAVRQDRSFSTGKGPSTPMPFATRPFRLAGRDQSPEAAQLPPTGEAVRCSPGHAARRLWCSAIALPSNFLSDNCLVLISPPGREPSIWISESRLKSGSKIADETAPVVLRRRMLRNRAIRPASRLSTPGAIAPTLRRGRYC